MVKLFLIQITVDREENAAATPQRRNVETPHSLSNFCRKFAAAFCQTFKGPKTLPKLKLKILL
jgi:hypothetical protein